MATVTAHYAQAALLGAEHAGKDTNALLDRAGMQASDLRDSSARVHENQLTHLIQLVWECLEDEFMGFTKTPCRRGAFALMCKLVSHCQSVDAMIRQGIAFYHVLTDEIQMDYRIHDDRREFVITMKDPERDFEHFYTEFWLVIWHRTVSWFTGQQIPLLEVHFAYPEPAHSAEFKHQFSCLCRYEQTETKFVFSKQFASYPLIRTQRELAKFLKRAPADLMTIPGEEPSLSREIKQALLNQENGSYVFPESADLARLFSISEQSLRRKLREEGTSYQRIKDTLRRDIAIEKLSKQGLSVNDVAEVLGFAEPRSFTRAFKKWVGLSPSHYQK